MDTLRYLIDAATSAILDSMIVLIPPTLAFAAISLAVKRRRAVADAFRASPEMGTNLVIHLFDALTIGPLLAFFVVWFHDFAPNHGLQLVPARAWDAIGLPFVVAFLAVFCGDFIGYWRHRLEHSWLLWPSHAVHHSDTEMTWTTLSRFHPINRVTTTVIDGAFLTMLGFPPYAVVANALVRHYYGHFVHADLPWTYGPLGRIFVSPAMHRWHHALDRQAFHTNYATVFSLFDVWFGTHRVPGPCDAPLGVTDTMAPGAFGQLTHPLKRSSYKRWKKRAPLRRAEARASAAPAAGVDAA
ncbi:sterol desaturase family protein [Aureimonas sp. Leaf324]|uniref:sterol desaturase family protein n=1 Tax=Aureimonas sp. Leaf324 TaxID=1736336 RepID=UPI0009EA71C0|nr:sterol desaturase family protein [Aureimonas sp. Leaf324]